MYIYINYYYSITIDIYFINLLTYYVSSIMYYINIVIDYNKLYISIIILIIYNITKTEHMYPLKHSLGTALSTSLRSVYINFTYMIGLTKRSHVAPKMQHATSILFVSQEKRRLGVRGNMDPPMRERRICYSVG